MSGYEELTNIESIKQLKARYFRFVDTHCWEDFLDLFTTDAIFDLGDGIRFEDAAGFVAFVRKSLDAIRSVHQGFMPENPTDRGDDGGGHLGHVGLSRSGWW